MNTTSVFSDANRHKCVADALGLGTISDGELGMDPTLLRQLYQHARNEDGQRTLFTHDSTFARGWVNLDTPQARELIDALVPSDDVDGLKHARRIARSQLEAQAWNDVLGIKSPPILCKVKIHGARWALRFQSAEPALRGQERINEELPPTAINAASLRDSVSEVPSDSVDPADDCAATVASDQSVEQILKRAGMSQ